MRKFILLLSAFVTVVAITGCGKTEEEKAEEKVNNFNSLQAKLNSMGIPLSSWDNAKLDEYERVLNAFEATYYSAKNDDNIKVYGNPEISIRLRREFLADAREEKARANTAAKSPKTKRESEAIAEAMKQLTADEPKAYQREL